MLAVFSAAAPQWRRAAWTSPGALEEVGTPGIEPKVAFDARVAGELLEEREPPRRPLGHGDGHGVVQCHDGLSDVCISKPYSATICNQSVSSPCAASSCTAAIAACTRYERRAPRDIASVTS
jgi:hypothetical protein